MGRLSVPSSARSVGRGSGLERSLWRLAAASHERRTFYVPQFMALYGPRFTLALPKFHPYVHALFGTVHGEAIVPAGDAVAKVSENAFGMGLGGGVNVSVSRHLWLRLIQVDYIRAQFNPNSQNETRISAGLVFRFGNW